MDISHTLNWMDKARPPPKPSQTTEVVLSLS